MRDAARQRTRLAPGSIQQRGSGGPLQARPSDNADSARRNVMRTGRPQRFGNRYRSKGPDDPLRLSYVGRGARTASARS